MVDRRYPVELAGRKFLVSREGGRFGRRSIPLQKAQQDTSDVAGEQSLNTDDLWRRSFETWHRGAGQSSFDRAGSDPYRFDASLGIDPWTKWQLGLLNETESKLASTASSIKLVVAGGYLYCADGQTLKYTTSITAAGAATWTTVTGTPAAAITGIASDGFSVWVAYGASGIYRTTRGSASAAVYHSLPAEQLGYVKGRLMAANNNALFNVTQPNAAVVNAGKATAGTTMIDTDIGGVPSPVAPGELVVIVVLWDDETVTINTPAGWTLVRTQTTAGAAMAMFYKVVATLTNTLSVTFTFSGATSAFSVLNRYENADPTSPLEASDSTSALSTPYVSPGTVATAREGSIFVFGAANTTPGAISIFTPPTGWDEEADMSVGGIGAIAVADQQVNVASAGAPTGRWEEAGTLINGNTIGILASFVSSTSPDENQIDALFTHGTSDFTWVGFAEGKGHIYAAGFAGDKSLIYRTEIRSDGTALDVPVVAGSLPDGEIVRSIYGYLGRIFIGTDNGVRMADSDDNGNLTFGAELVTGTPVRCFEGQGRFVWFGLEDYDVSRWTAGTLDGLGRLDVTSETEPLVAAWASDLMVAASTSTTESVQSVVTFQDRRVLAIGTSNALPRGVYAEKANKVATGYLDSGLITYGIADTKVATYLDLRHSALVGSLQAYLSADEAAFASIGVSTVAGSKRPAVNPLPAGPARGDVHELRIRLNRDSGADAVGPTVTRMTLRSEPAPSRGRIIQWPLVLTSKLTVQGQEVSEDPAEALAFIEALFDTQTLITCKEDDATFSAFLKDFEMVHEHRTFDKKAEQGICTVTLKVPGA